MNIAHVVSNEEKARVLCSALSISLVTARTLLADDPELHPLLFIGSLSDAQRKALQRADWMDYVHYRFQPAQMPDQEGLYYKLVGLYEALMTATR